MSAGFAEEAVAAAGTAIAWAAHRLRIARTELMRAGDRAPDFATEAVSGDEVAPVGLDDFRGTTFVLYFYPKDDTPGCTAEACAFRDGYARLKAAGLEVLGCSTDGAAAHRAFIRKYGLPFRLLVDRDCAIARAYGAVNGIPIVGLNRRVSYVIDGDGLIRKVYPHVDPAAHAAEILRDVGPGAEPATP